MFISHLAESVYKILKKTETTYEKTYYHINVGSVGSYGLCPYILYQIHHNKIKDMIEIFTQQT